MNVRTVNWVRSKVNGFRSWGNVGQVTGRLAQITGKLGQFTGRLVRLQVNWVRSQVDWSDLIINWIRPQVNWVRSWINWIRPQVNWVRSQTVAFVLHIYFRRPEFQASDFAIQNQIQMLIHCRAIAFVCLWFWRASAHYCNVILSDSLRPYYNGIYIISW